MEKINFNGGRDGLHDAAYLRALHFAAPKKIVESIGAPHPKIDDLYLTRRARGQIGGVEGTIASLLRYDTARKNDSRSGVNIYSSGGNSDIASQLGVQPYTILPSPTKAYSSPGQSLGYKSPHTSLPYSGSSLNNAYENKKGLEYLV